MKHLITVALILSLAAVLGCAPQDSTPADRPETAADEPITEEDFESGEPEALEEGEDEARDDAAGDTTEEPGT